MTTPKVFPCNTCELVFDDSQAQRTHWREAWHVYNLKRRMAELPPISADTYSETVATSLVTVKQESSHSESSSTGIAVNSLKPKHSKPNVDEPENLIDDEDDAQSDRCLFCLHVSEDVETNLEHMSTEHGLYIPELDHLSSLEAIIGYLQSVIIDYNECLYCGMIKLSAEGVRRHMLDKGHCMINLEREPELLEFWQFSDSDNDEHEMEDEDIVRTVKTDSGLKSNGLNVSEDEYRLPLGRTMTSKTKAREARLIAHRAATAKERSRQNQILNISPPNENDIDDSSAATAITRRPQRNTQAQTEYRIAIAAAPGGSSAVTVRDAVGLVGVPDQRIRSLITVQRKMQRQQAVIRASASWADELGGRNQKHYKQKMNLRDG